MMMMMNEISWKSINNFLRNPDNIVTTMHTPTTSIWCCTNVVKMSSHHDKTWPVSVVSADPDVARCDPRRTCAGCGNCALTDRHCRFLWRCRWHASARESTSTRSVTPRCRHSSLRGVSASRLQRGAEVAWHRKPRRSWVPPPHHRSLSPRTVHQHCHVISYFAFGSGANVSVREQGLKRNGEQPTKQWWLGQCRQPCSYVGPTIALLNQRRANNNQPTQSTQASALDG